MSRLADPEQCDLLRGFFVFVVPAIGKLKPKRAFAFPQSAVAELGDLADQLPLFCFPYPESSSVAIKRQEFTFVFTDDKGTYLFGFCYQKEPATPASDGECLCIVSQRPLSRLFQPVLHVLHDLWSQGARDKIESLLSRLIQHYAGGNPQQMQFSFRDDSANKVYTLACHETAAKLGYAEPVQGDPDVLTLLRTLSATNLVALFASILFERRVIIVSEDLGTATGCVLGLERLCHPISWEGVYISIMPNHLLDYCSAPMPFLVGLHMSNWALVERMPLDEHVRVMADEDKVFAPFDDYAALPNELTSKLKSEFKRAKSIDRKTRKMQGADEKFCTAIATVLEKLMGDFREHIRQTVDKKTQQKNAIEIDIESFVSSKPKNYHRSRALLGASQSLRAYVDRRIAEITNRGSLSRDAEVSAAATTSRSAMVENEAQPAGLRGRAKSVSTKSSNILNRFMKSRPDLQDEPSPHVYKAIWLGTASGIVESMTLSTVANCVAEKVLSAQSLPSPVLVLIFSDSIFLVEEKSGILIQDFSADEIIHCQTARQENGLPLLTLVSMKGTSLVRSGHALATKSDKLSAELVAALHSACPYLVSTGTPRDPSMELYATSRRAHSVRYLGGKRVRDASVVTLDWLELLVTKRPFPYRESVLIVTANSVRIVEPLTHRQLHRNSSSIINVETIHWTKWPSKDKRNSKGDLAASSMRMTEAQRVEVMKKVSERRMTPEEAIELVTHTESELYDTCVCYTWHDDTLDCDEVVVVGLTGGSSRAEELVDDLKQFRRLALKGKSDPFLATSAAVKSASGTLIDYEFDRNKLHAIKALGVGSTGTVHLANRTIAGPLSESAEASSGSKWRLLQNSVLENQRDEICAVKVLNSAARRDQRDLFLAMCSLEFGLKHPNIVAIFGVCLSQKPLLKVMESVQYGDLKRVLEACTLKQIQVQDNESIFMLQQVASALDYLHDRRIVHSNVTASSMLLHDNCTIKLSKFVNARKYEAGENFFSNKDDSVVLPYLHAAPESVPPGMFVARGIEVPQIYTPRLSQTTDVWGFGVTVWEVVTYGAQPYGKDRDIVSVLEKIVNGNESLRCPVNTNGGLQALVLSCMAMEAAQRPTFTLLIETLKQLGKSVGMESDLRDIGQMVSPKLAVQLETLASSVLTARRETIQKLSDLLVEKEKPISPQMRKTVRRKSGQYFDLKDWRLDNDGNLVRVSSFVESEVDLKDGVAADPVSTISPLGAETCIGKDVDHPRSPDAPLTNGDGTTANHSAAETEIVDAAPGEQGAQQEDMSNTIEFDPSNPFAVACPPTESHSELGNATDSTLVSDSDDKNPLPVPEESTNPFDAEHYCDSESCDSGDEALHALVSNLFADAALQQREG